MSNRTQRKPELEPFAAKVRELNALHGLTLTQLSSLADISIPTLSNFINARQKPSPRNVGKLVNVYGCDFATLDNLVPKH